MSSRYLQWILFRVRILLASWKGKLMFALLFVVLAISQFGIQVLSSPSAMAHMMDMVKASPGGGPSTGLFDPMALPQDKDLRQAISDYNRMPDWLASLENDRMVPPGVKIMVSHPELLSNRQMRLLKVQGLKVMPWSEPGEKDELTAVPEYWVQWNDQANTWLILSRPLDIALPQSGPGPLVVLRAILWIDKLDALEQWERENPAPQAPADLQPGGVQASLLPSSANNILMATCAIWVVSLAIMSILSLIQMSSWGNVRATGSWLPFAGLSHDTYAFLWSQAAWVCLPVLVFGMLGGVLAKLFLASLGHDIGLDWVWRSSFVVFLASLVSYTISTLLQCAPSGKEARQVLGAGWVLLLAGVNLWVSSNWSSLRPLAAFLSSYGVLLAFVVALGVSAASLYLAAWRLDAHARRAYTSQ